jgi:hypothetical protein
MSAKFEFPETLSGDYVSSAEKLVIAQEGIPFQIKAVQNRVGRFGDEFVLSVLLPDPETGSEAERLLTFSDARDSGSPTSRDQTLAAIQAHFAEHGEAADAPLAKLNKVGQFYQVIPA